MDPKTIESIWKAFQEVQEGKKKAPVTDKDDDGEGMDPVGQEDGDIDNDGDKDSSDKYLKNRRKAVGKAMKKEGKIPPQFMKKGKDDDKEDDDSDDSDDKKEKGKKPEKGENPFAKKKDKEEVKESEESPYPSLDKKKREKKGSNLEDAGGPAAKLKGESVEDGEKEECPKCKGEGCDHCDGKGYHMAKKETYGKKMKESNLFSAAELEAIEEKMKQPNDSGTKAEPFMSTNSAGEKKFYADHEKGGDKKLEDMEATGEMDGSKAGKAVKSQAPKRRGENRKGDTAMPKVNVHPGQIGKDLKAGI